MKHHKPALILSLTLLILLPPLPAKERRGAEVLIRKIDGAEIQGELIAVKTAALLVLTKEGKDVTTPVSEIDYVKLIKKARPWRGAGIGLLVGGALGATKGAISPGDAEPFRYYVMVYGLAVAVPGALLGLILSGLEAKDITYQIQGWPTQVVKARLGHLRKRARVREYD